MGTSSSTVGFVHLHTHSEFSPIDSLAKVKDLVASAAADGNPALAVTDHGTLGGLWKLGQCAAAAGIKPIPGIEVYLAIGDRHGHGSVQVPDEDDADPDTDGGKGTKRKVYEHLTLLAATRQGWHNLVAMTNESHDSLWYKPRIDYDLLAQYAEGIIVMTGCLGGPVAGPLSRGDRGAAVANLNHLVACVGKDNVYIEVMDHGIDAQLRIMDEMRSVAAELNLPLVATNDSHYIHANQQGAHDAWLAVGTRKRLTDTDRFRFHGSGYHLRTEAEMRALQGGTDWWQEACDNTVAVAARIDTDVLPEPRLRLPKFPLPAGFTTAGEYLRHLVREGAFERYGQDPDRPGRLPLSVNTQLKYEFGVISSAGMDDYFLIVHDVIAWARSDRGLPTVEFPLGEAGKKAPIRVGPGRGSAAGSTMSYCLKIVGVDPLANHLLFERFLNPERTGMPDIDVDFEQNRRPEVLRYIERRFGRDRVARIGTFGIAATRRAILDAARVLGVTNLGEKLSPLVPIGGSGKPYSLKALADTTDKAGDAFRAAVVDAGEPAQEILALAREFEGVTKLEGIHACGTLIADEPMASLVPLRRDLGKDATPEDLLVTVWDGKDVDSYGLLKMDVLGLRNLDVISAAVSFIQTTTGELIDPDTLIPNNPDDLERDAKVWDLIGSGRTAGVFQLDSTGITKLAEQIAPNSLADLTALVALFRPGPLAAGMHEHYAARKNGREAVDYGYLTIDLAEQAAIASVLNDTYGVVAYQEQLMRLSQVVGGLTPGMRNKLQKAFSKKSSELMAEVKGAMFAGALAGDGTSGVKFKKATLERLWETFEGSASYLFNQSHACAYGFVTYVTAYLKANWPVQYGAALLAMTDDDDKRRLTIRSLQQEGISILAPDINRSGASTTPDGDAVRLGLSEVKGVGKNAGHIVTERDRGGGFASISDVLTRVKIPKDSDGGLGVVPVNVIEALIEVGAFDAFGPRMGQSMVLRAARAVPDIRPVDAEWGILERSARQRARLGLTTGEHPLIALCDQVREFTHRGVSPSPVQAAQRAKHGARVTLLGVLSSWDERSYRRGRMVSLTLEGSRESVEGVMWDEERAHLDVTPKVGQVVAVTARVQVRLVSTERVGDDGETIAESFERRDLTVEQVVTVPVDDPSTLVLPEVADFVAPETSELDLDGSASTEVSLQGDFQDPPDADAPEGVTPVWVGEYPPPVEPPGDDEWADPDPGGEPSSTVDETPVSLPVPAADADQVVIRLPVRSLGRTHPDLLNAVTTHGVPAGFCDPAGGVWSVPATDGRTLLVIVGEHAVPGAAHMDQQAIGWLSLSVPQNAAA